MQIHLKPFCLVIFQTLYHTCENIVDTRTLCVQLGYICGLYSILNIILLLCSVCELKVFYAFNAVRTLCAHLFLHCYTNAYDTFWVSWTFSEDEHVLFIKIILPLATFSTIFNFDILAFTGINVYIMSWTEDVNMP